MKRALLAWSSGKDSAWSLHLLRQNPEIEVVGLLTTINEAFDRVAMHAVRRALLERQCEAAGLPLWPVPIPWPCSNLEYEARMSEVCRRAVSEGVETIAFGDLYLADIRAYREKQLAGTGLEPIFPVWKLPTDTLAREMIRSGLRAKITCVDPKILPPSFAGGNLTKHSLPISRPASIRAARTASSTPSSTTVRCSAAPCPSKPAK